MAYKEPDGENMTVSEFGRMLARYWYVVVATAVICAGGMIAYLSMQPAVYEATATATVSEEPGGIGGLANTLIANTKTEGVALSSGTDINAKKVTITASGNDADKCITAANTTMEQLFANAKTVYPDVTSSISEASTVHQISAEKKKRSAYAFIAGAFIAIVALLIIDGVRRPIRSRKHAEELTHLPVLDVLPTSDKGERLASNIAFANGKDPKTVCVIPTGDPSCAKRVAELAAEGFAHGAAVDITPCDSFANSMNAAHAAQKADATILVIRGWSDKQTAVEDTLAELTLANANVIGFVYLNK